MKFSFDFSFDKAGSLINVNPEILDAGKLERLLQAYGIASEFIEFSGNVARIALENRLHILRTMGVVVDSGAQLDQSLHERVAAEFACWLPSVVVLSESNLTCVLAIDQREREQMAAAAGKIYWRVQLEYGGELSGEWDPARMTLLSTHAIEDRVYERREGPLPSLPPGYHHIECHGHDCHVMSLLVVAPTCTWQPDCLSRKLWGLSVQLYSLRSGTNWGMGDFADLLELIAAVAKHNAAFLLLNPLHALDLRYPENASPYSPTDRRYLNPLYIAPALCEEFNAPEVQAHFHSAETQAKLEQLRAANFVDYGGVCVLKLGILEVMYAAFCRQTDGEQPSGTSRARRDAFRTFAEAGGQQLAQFAEFQTEQHAANEGALANSGFHLWLQWIAQEQLEACQRAALSAGMPIGLIRDLAVGSSIGGSEVRANPGLFCEHARIGAPPDNFNPDGQNWGLPPLVPTRLQETQFSHFIALLRSNMRGCSALRIDHVMSLMRLWWCPDDGSNAGGAYVHYPVDALFALLRVESMRNRCAVIGEDLGVVPPEIRRYLDEGKVYSNAVFYFEKYDGWHFRKPEHYKEMALAMIANHDVPPLAAWWNCHDVELRREIGLISDDEKLRQECEYRNGEKGQLLQWLAEQNLLPHEWHDRDLRRPFDTSLRLALVRACGRAASRMVSLQIDDLVGVDTPVNIPGTSTEYPNWRRKIPLPLDAIFDNPESQALLRALAEARNA